MGTIKIGMPNLTAMVEGLEDVGGDAHDMEDALIEEGWED